MSEGPSQPPPLPGKARSNPLPPVTITPQVAGPSPGCPSPRGPSVGSRSVSSPSVESAKFAGAGFTGPGIDTFGSAAGASAPKRPPIRPVGFVNPRTVTVIAIVVTSLQILAAGLSGWYFLDLRRYDVTTRMTAGDSLFDLTTAFLGDPWVDEDDADDPTLGVFWKKWKQAERLVEPLFYGNLAIAWIELICLCVWQYRVRQNAAALGSVDLRRSAVMGVVWWIVPYASMVLPFIAVQEIWRASDPSVPPGDGRAWRVKPGSPLIAGWWGALVLTKVLYWFTAIMLMLSMITVVSPITLLVISLAGTVVAGLLQLELIRRLSKRQEALYARRMRAVEKAEAAGEPTVQAAAAPA